MTYKKEAVWNQEKDSLQPHFICKAKTHLLMPSIPQYSWSFLSTFFSTVIPIYVMT